MTEISTAFLFSRSSIGARGRCTSRRTHLMTVCPQCATYSGPCTQEACHKLVRCSACMLVNRPPSVGKAASASPTTLAATTGLDFKLTLTKGQLRFCAHRCSSLPSPAGKPAFDGVVLMKSCLNVFTTRLHSTGCVQSRSAGRCVKCSTWGLTSCQ